MMSNINLVLLLILFGLGVYIFVNMCGKMEGYWSLPFAGGDIRTYLPDPHRIEGRLGRALDESDSDSANPGDYPM